jgi:divalent metal cation (Fe/Co/Zn/Cd) transporter
LSNKESNLTPFQVKAMLHRGLLLEYASIGWMTAESIFSVLAGLLAGSLALIAFGGDSLVELVSAIAVAAFLRSDRAGRGSSEVLERTERVTRLLLVLLIPTIGLGTLYAAVSGVRAESSVLGITVAVGAVLIMPVLWLQKRSIGMKTGCRPILNDAVESATCLFMSIALLAGLTAVWFYGLWWADDVATIAILAFVVKEVREAYSEEQ